ncbi:hypothetical protein PX554_22120, partial [Sphingomonas sp. H39-1-10]|uniref:hypothetical protein n=1 Tax=Sphingomonas pollutisoli TaxID=3030829 RepID=UPI0023BA09FB
MGNRHFRRSMACGIFLTASTSTASIAVAQSFPPTINAPPIRSPVDANGVNLATGGIEISTTDLLIGAPGKGGLAHKRVWTGNGWRHGFFLSLVDNGANVLVSIGAQSATFTLSGGVYVSDQANGSTLTASTGLYTYTAPDGTIITFDSTYRPNLIYYGSVSAIGSNIILPSGEKLALTYKFTKYNIQVGYIYVAALKSVNSTSGYQLKYGYGSDGFTINKVTAINNGIDYCDPAADTCTALTQSWPSVSYSSASVGSTTQESVTDALNRVIRYTTNNTTGRLTGIKRPSSTNDNVLMTAICAAERVYPAANLSASGEFGL